MKNLCSLYIHAIRPQKHWFDGMDIDHKTTSFLTVCSCHLTYTFQSESILYSCLNVKELLARSRCKIWSLSDCTWTCTQNHLGHKRTLNHLAKLTKLAKLSLALFKHELKKRGFVFEGIRRRSVIYLVTLNFTWTCCRLKKAKNFKEPKPI